MVASTTETLFNLFNKVSFNQKNFHVLSFIYRLNAYTKFYIFTLSKDYILYNEDLNFFRLQFTKNLEEVFFLNFSKCKKSIQYSIEIWKIIDRKILSLIV